MTRPVTMDVIARDKSTATLARVSGGYKNLARQVDNTNATSSRSFRNASREADNFGSHLKSVAKVSAGLLLGVGVAAVSMGKSFVDAANDQRKANAQTAAVIKSTGGAAKVTAKQISDLSGSISAQTGIMDDTIQASANMLLTFKNIRNEVGKGNDVFNQATKVVTDMSVALGQDGTKSAIQLGKALNDPVKGLTALQRVGVTFSESQKATIKRLVETGDTLGAQKIILKELNSEFGGSAAAQATAGDKMKAAWDNVKESIGNLLLPVLDRLANWFVKTGLPALQSFIGWVKDHWPEIQAAIADAWTKVQPTLMALRDIFTQQIAPAVATAATWLKDHLVPALVGLADWISKHQTLVESFGIAVAAMMAAFKLYAVINLTRDAIKGLTLAMATNPILAAAAALLAIGAALLYAYKKSADFRAGLKVAISDIKIWGLEVAQFVLRYVVIPVLDVFSTIVHGAADAFGWVPGLGPKLKKARDAFDDWRKGVDGALSGIKVQIDTEQANIKIANFQAQIDNIKQGKVPGLTANNEAGKARIKDLQDTINALKQVKTPNVTTETKNGLSAIATLQRKIDEIKQGFVPGINVHTKKGQDALADLQAQINALTGKTVPVKVVYDTSAVGGGGAAIGGRPVSGATGGKVTGPGTGTSDSIPAWLSSGEYVVNARSTAKFLPMLENMNKNKFAAGGLITINMPSNAMVTSALDSITSGLHPSISVASLPGPAVSGGISALQAYAASLFPAYGWSAAAQLGSLISLWNGESGWDPAAYNAASGATGIPQALPASKMASAGADYLTNGATQIRWGLGYIADRYGSPSAAWNFWQSQSPHWYGRGLAPTVFSRPTLIGVGESGPETVSVRSGRYGGAGVVVAPGAITVYAARGQDERAIAAQAFTMLKAWVAEEERRAAKGGRA